MRIFACKERYALAHLLCNGLVAVAIGGVERAVVAICATAPPLCAVAVGAGETTVKGYLLHLKGELLLQVVAKVIVVETLNYTHINANLQKANDYIPLLGS